MTRRIRPELQSPTRRKLALGLAALPLAALTGVLPSIATAADFPTAKVNTTGLAVTDKEVIVGQLHSATGTMAISETGSIQAERLAIEQINAMGGVLGRQIKIVQEDGASDWPTFAEKAKKLIVNDKVASVFGCSNTGSTALRDAEVQQPMIEATLSLTSNFLAFSANVGQSLAPSS